MSDSLTDFWSSRAIAAESSLRTSQSAVNTLKADIEHVLNRAEHAEKQVADLYALMDTFRPHATDFWNQMRAIFERKLNVEVVDSTLSIDGVNSFRVIGRGTIFSVPIDQLPKGVETPQNLMGKEVRINGVMFLVTGVETSTPLGNSFGLIVREVKEDDN